jgi:pimeloyl-ACP methyl ester carboxylesterase
MRQGSLRYLLGPAGFFTLRWWEWGPPSGPPVVCVHGLTRCGRDFDVLARALAAEGRRVLCPDLPGRGASAWLPDPALYAPGTYAVALSHLVARLEGPVDWVGTSLGGILGMMLAAAPGTPLRRLVLNDTGFHIALPAILRIHDYLRAAPASFPDLAALERHLREIHAPFGALDDAAWRHMAETSALPAPGRDGGGDEGMDGGGTVRLHYDPAIATPILAAAPEAMDLSALWAGVALPTLVLRGETSDLLPAATAEEMARRPGVELATIPGVGHAPALMDAAQTGLVARFLR